MSFDTRSIPAPAPAPKRSQPKKSVESAWALWRADGSSASGSEFLQSVSSWTEGTAAQLLRQQWSAEARRPSSPEVQERLRHHLGLAACGEQSSYRDALGSARRAVIEELRQARGARAGSEPSVTRG
jgi:hypothetical protein